MRTNSLTFVVTVLALALLASAATSGAGAAPGADRDDADAGRYIVVLDRGRPQEVADEHRRRHGAEVAHVYTTALRGYAAAMSAQAAGRIARDDRVAYVDEDTPVHALHHRCGHTGGPGGDPCDDDGGGDDSSDSELTIPWGVARTGARDAHVNGDTGEGVDIYVVDSGIQADHPNLPNVGAGHAVVACHKPGRQGCAADWDDDHGHGTHVAGTAAAADTERIVGVAPDATLHAVKVLDRMGRGWRSDVIAGIDWVADQEAGPGQAAVANVSLGASGSKTGNCNADDGFTGTDSYHEAICGATHESVVFAVAAGNSDADASGTVPAAYDDTVMTISATTCNLLGAEEEQDCEDGSDDWADFSNYGNVITVAAPGEDVLSTWIGSDYHVGSGTSMASPHAAGAAALLIGSNVVTSEGYAAFADAQATIVDNAESTDSWPPNEDHDEGFLDALAALGG